MDTRQPVSVPVRITLDPAAVGQVRTTTAVDVLNALSGTDAWSTTHTAAFVRGLQQLI